MIINFMTWNTQLYEYGNKLSENSVKSIDDCKFDDTINIVRNHMDKTNAIAVLQEIPYKSNLTWNEHELFTKLKKKFPENKYDMIYNISSKYQIKMTIVLANKGLIELDDNGINSTGEEYCNCFVSFNIKDTDLHVLAVHQPLKKGGHVSDKLNKKTNYKPNVILGDFNAGDYSKKNETDQFIKNRDDYKNLLERGYKDICEGQITRKKNGYEAPIDHILLDKNVMDNFSYNNVIVGKDVSFSDHYPIYCEIENRE